MADHRVVCYEEGGVMTEEYTPLFVTGITMFVMWNIGVPIFFGYLLIKHRDTIASGNQHFAGVAHLRPLFIFLHPTCYMFEVYFMAEKLLLTGVLAVLRVYLGGYFAVTLLSLIVTGTMLCVIVHAQPSRTAPYNVANIIAHAFQFITLYTSIVLKNPMPEDSWATPDRVMMALACLQVPFWLYLIHVSIGKIREMYRLAKTEAKSSERRKQMLEHKLHDGKTDGLSVGNMAAEAVYRAAMQKKQEASIQMPDAGAKDDLKPPRTPQLPGTSDLPRTRELPKIPPSSCSLHSESRLQPGEDHRPEMRRDVIMTQTLPTAPLALSDEVPCADVVVKTMVNKTYKDLDRLRGESWHRSQNLSLRTRTQSLMYLLDWKQEDRDLDTRGEAIVAGQVHASFDAEPEPQQGQQGQQGQQQQHRHMSSQIDRIDRLLMSTAAIIGLRRE
eukprot:SAG31_NODE_2459_length_5660_cov_13.094947_2_plen_443_part_00